MVTKEHINVKKINILLKELRGNSMVAMPYGKKLKRLASCIRVSLSLSLSRATTLENRSG